MPNKPILQDEIRHESGKEVVVDSSVHFNLPQGMIQGISIRHTVGTPDVGNYVPNSIFRAVEVKINGKSTGHWRSNRYPKTPVPAIAGAREYWRHSMGVRIRDERVDFIFPTPLRETDKLDVNVEFSAAADVSDGAATTYTGATVSIFYRLGAPLEGTAYQKARWFNERIGTNPKKWFVPSEGRAGKAIIFAVTDDGVYSDDYVGDIEIEEGNQIIFKGSWSDLQMRTEEASTIETTTGFAILQLPLRPIPADSLSIEITPAAGATDIRCDYGVISLES